MSLQEELKMTATQSILSQEGMYKYGTALCNLSDLVLFLENIYVDQYWR